MLQFLSGCEFERVEEMDGVVGFDIQDFHS